MKNIIYNGVEFKPSKSKIMFWLAKLLGIRREGTDTHNGIETKVVMYWWNNKYWVTESTERTAPKPPELEEMR